MRIIALAVTSPGVSPEQFEPYFQTETMRLWELYKAGLVREIYFQENTYRAVLILECATVAEAKAALDSFPLVEAGIISFDLIPLAPYDGFEVLFASS